LYAALQAIKELYGEANPEHREHREAMRLQGEEWKAYHRRIHLPFINPNWVINFDASLMRSFDVTSYMKKIKGAKGKKQVVNKTGLRQGYNLYFGCTASGRVLPPMICVKARKGVKLGEPLVVEIKDPMMTSNFWNGDKVRLCVMSRRTERNLPNCIGSTSSIPCWL
jgi:hypothetical protein